MPDTEGIIISADGGGILGKHPVREDLPLPVAPTHEKAFNTLRAAVFPVACWKADDVNFDFDSAFVRPEVGVQMPRFKKLMDDHPGSPLSVFGHADPVGDEEYNKRLSGSRAKAIYAMLIRKPEIWEELYSAGSLKMNHVQVMLQHLGFDPGRTDGVTDGPHKDAVKAFQEKAGVANDGSAGPTTRKALYKAYMDALCVDEKGETFVVPKESFLGEGKDAGGKADYQGCSEFNPLLLFSKEQDAAFKADKDKTPRDLANAPNRRVLVLLFRAGAKIDVTKWPCPRASENTAGCRKRFWSDADKRAQLTDEERQHIKTRDTFRCRFYQRMTDRSPCERPSAFIVARLYDHEGNFIAHAPFTLTLPDGKTFHDVADSRGFASLSDNFEADRGILEWSTVSPKDNPTTTITFKQDVFFTFKEDDASLRNRLINLGYTTQPDLNAAVKDFHKDYEKTEDLDPDGALGPKTRAAIVKVHDALADQIRNRSDKA